MTEKQYKKKLTTIYELLDVATAQLHAALSALGKISAEIIDFSHEPEVERDARQMEIEGG